MSPLELLESELKRHLQLAESYAADRGASLQKMLEAEKQLEREMAIVCEYRTALRLVGGEP